MSEQKVSIFWFRRDLRLDDNHGLYQALKGDYPVLPLFIFDWNILDKLSNSRDARVQFIWQEIEKIKSKLESENSSSLIIKYGKPDGIWEDMVEEYNIGAVYTNRDYEPYARNRDQAIYSFLKNRGIPFKGFKDQVIFEKSEIAKDNGEPYQVYTPYMKRYKARLGDNHLQQFPVQQHAGNFYKCKPIPSVPLGDMGFQEFPFKYPDRAIDREIIRNYHKTRDIPSIKGTTRLSLHLRFGTISIRKLAKTALEENEKYFDELIWRDFYQSIIYHYPKSEEEAFKPAYDRVKWENNEKHFKAWCEAKTGYPLVDAGMRELNNTGFMHNRIRMLVASFLTKHLLIDWRWGEAYFAEKLLDYESGSNVGGWQWAAGSGVDAAPYFRIFSPERQLERFDKDLKYVKKWVPEYGSEQYPQPIVDHKEARQRALDRYKSALN